MPFPPDDGKLQSRVAALLQLALAEVDLAHSQVLDLKSTARWIKYDQSTSNK